MQQMIEQDFEVTDDKALSTLAASPAPGLAIQITDPGGASVCFQVRVISFARISGHFKRLSGKLLHDPGQVIAPPEKPVYRNLPIIRLPVPDTPKIRH